MTTTKTRAPVPPLHVLILDDDYERVHVLREVYEKMLREAKDGKWVLDRKIFFTSVSTIGGFAEELAKCVFDVVVLDHDLGPLSFTSSTYNGQMAAAMLAGVYASSHRPTPQVVVWSHNPDGARAIKRRLADFQVVDVEPYSEQLCTRLCHQWTTCP